MVFQKPQFGRHSEIPAKYESNGGYVGSVLGLNGWKWNIV